MVGTTVGTNTVQFNAQGIFGFANSPKTEKFRDVTNHSSTNWFPNSPIISYLGNGQFVGVTTGCTFFTVSDGGFSQSVVVGINTAPASCPTPPAALPMPPAPH
jgi:hypothetical protein